jgi:inosine-uridine nucleoside N-ribohydrolase
MQLHLDTDIGGDIDDLCALALLLAWPDVDISGITTVAEHAGKRAGYARYALELAGRTDVPVRAGADTGLDCFTLPTGLPAEDRYWPEPVPPAPGPVEAALDLLEHSIQTGATIVGIGPFTNLSLLERRRPGTLRDAHLFLMGGHLFSAPPDFPAWTYESDYNVQADPVSARHVLESATCTLIPIEVTAQTALRRAHLPALARGGPLAQLIARQASAFATDYCNDEQYARTCAAVPDDIINFQHDPLACAAALGWQGVTIEHLPVVFEMQGPWLCGRIDAAGPPQRVVTAVDGPRFNALWAELVTVR